MQGLGLLESPPCSHMQPHAQQAPPAFCMVAACLGAAVVDDVLPSRVWRAVVEAILMALGPTRLTCFQQYLECSPQHCVEARRVSSASQHGLQLEDHAKHHRGIRGHVKLYMLEGYWRWQFQSVKNKLLPSLGANGDVQMIWTVHHLLCWWAHGPPPAGKKLACHSVCDNKLCLNPHHLSWGDQKANAEQAHLHRAHAKRQRGCVHTGSSALQGLSKAKKRAKSKKGPAY